MNTAPALPAARASFPRASVARRENARALSRLRNPLTTPQAQQAAWTVARDAQSWLGTLARA